MTLTEQLVRSVSTVFNYVYEVCDREFFEVKSSLAALSSFWWEKILGVH